MAKGKRHSNTRSRQMAAGIRLGGTAGDAGGLFGEVIRASMGGYLRVQLVDEGPFRGWRIETKKPNGRTLRVENDILEDGLTTSLELLRKEAKE